MTEVKRLMDLQSALNRAEYWLNQVIREELDFAEIVAERLVDVHPELLKGVRKAAALAVDVRTRITGDLVEIIKIDKEIRKNDKD